MSLLVPPGGTATVVIPAAAGIAVFSQGGYQVFQQSAGNPNQVPTLALITEQPANAAMFVSAVFAAGATLVVQATGGVDTLYEVGVNATVKQLRSNSGVQITPVVLNTTGPLTAAAILSGTLTSTTAAIVAGTLPTGTVLDAASTWLVNEYLDWTVINTGPSAFNVTAAAGHTIVGAAAVATATSGIFRTVRTAANTFISYRRS